ncbi:hypothetical protein CLF_107380 [Clonorchis sinensis]|uniref:Uncharacterized protein n=2 Tax=Clonorchis sinensis TaxID=79923 RepID=G7YGP5_CLOSI|nr:hypothetical protein CLF_107380 [Clonorchis sinensis]
MPTPAYTGYRSETMVIEDLELWLYALDSEFGTSDVNASYPLSVTQLLVLIRSHSFCLKTEGSFKPDYANQQAMRRHIRVSKPKRKYFSSKKPQRSAPKRSSHALRKTRTHKTATLVRHTPVCSNPSPTGLISVHRLIDSTALAGQELLANNGHVVKSVVAHVSSAVQANDQHTPNVRRRSFEQPTRSTLLPMNGNIHPSDHHPFLHSWEYSDDYVTSRSWRSRRNTYLALRLIHSDAVDSYDKQENLSDDCALSSFSFKTGDTTSKLTTRTTKTAHKRPWVRRSEFVSPPTSYGDDYAISLELEAQRKLLSSLEPCVLGYRWPTLVIEEGRVNVASKLSPMVDRETMVLWR